MDKLNEFKKNSFKQLDQFMPVAEKVHGPRHKEIFDVAKIYGRIKAKLSSGDYKLDKEFAELKKTTNNYRAPDDVCETYEYIYNKLEELNKIYDGI